jgi:dTDP-glucose 4,6-dehydratase
MKKKVLITGGSGFIGCNLINYLSKKNFEILNVDKITYCSTDSKFINFKKNKYKFFKVNLSYKSKIKKLLKKFQVNTIVHLAAESHVDRSIDDPYSFIKDNILSTTSLYESVKDLFKKRMIPNPNIIHISTDEVFGSIKKKTVNEDSNFCTSSPYSASKASTECIAMAFAKTYGLKISIARLCNNYGPYQFTEKFIPTCIMRIMSDDSIPIYGNGKNIREWMFVKDSCEALFLILKNFKPNEVYNIGSGYRYNNLQIVRSLSKVLKKKTKINFINDRPGHDERYALNSSKFMNNFNWRPHYKLHTGLKITTEWFAQNKEWVNQTLKNYKGQRLGK